MTKYEVLLFLHILGAFLLLAGVGTTTALSVRSAATTSTRVIVWAADLELKAERFAIWPGAILLVVFGTWLVSELGYGYGDAWISTAYVLLSVGVAVGALILAPIAKRLRQRGEQLIADGIEESDELRQMADEPRGKIFGTLVTVLVVVALVLMVFKPGA